jgi:hypothetical protein
MCDDLWQTVKKRKLSPPSSPSYTLSLPNPTSTFHPFTDTILNITFLPHEILVYIFSFLDFQSFTQLCFVCKIWLVDLSFFKNLYLNFTSISLPFLNDINIPIQFRRFIWILEHCSITFIFLNSTKLSLITSGILSFCF